MFWWASKLLLVFLNCVVATASGSIDRVCLPPRNKGLSEYVLVDCEDALSSIETITHSFGGGTSFGGTVLSAINGTAYANASKQYASAVAVTAPSYIVRATNPADVQAAIMFAAHCEYKVTARSGGHSYVGSSSCDGDKTPCIQIDVGQLNHIDVTALPTGSNRVMVGPGVHLEDLYPVLINNDIYIPAGACSAIGVGGHMQTGGLGIFGRSLGRFNSHVTAFDIVLADGSLFSVSSPQNKVTSKFNDDLWYAVIGGASGSFGVIVDITFNPVKEIDHFSFYWEVYFLYSDDTKHCIKNMLQEFANMLEDGNFTTDLRWNVLFTITGSKTYLSTKLGPNSFNSIKLDFTWVAPSSSNRTETFFEAQAIYNRLHDAFTFQGIDSKCLTLDQYFESRGEPLTSILKAQFPSTYATAADTKSMSELHSSLTLFDWGALGFEERGIPFKTSYQQGPKYPNADDLLEVFDLIDALIPTDPLTHGRFVLSQIGILPGPPHSISNVAQPFQEDVIGVAFDVWSFDGVDYSQHQRELQNLVISSVGGVNHRVFAAAYEDTCLECGAWKNYFDSSSKYDILRRIKGCVDPENLFKFRMSIPGMKRRSKSNKAGKP